MHTFLSKIPELTQNSSKKLKALKNSKSKTRFAEKKSKVYPDLGSIHLRAEIVFRAETFGKLFWHRAETFGTK